MSNPFTLNQYLLLAILVALALCVSAQADNSQQSFRLLEPSAGSISKTPLTETFKWSQVSGASSYKITIRVSGRKTPVIEASVTGTDYRAALRPGTSYEWNVTTVGTNGETKAENGPAKFATSKPYIVDTADPNVLFAGARPGAYFAYMPKLKEDPTEPISPWYGKKKFNDPPPPTFDQVRDKLPKPVWEGHEALTDDMYWHAWKTLFSVWLYAPKGEKHSAVSNVIGMPTWAGWGSTMVWDTAFIMQFARYGHYAYPFVTAFDNCYARQHENGFICRETKNDNSEVYVVYPANPPLLHWAEWRNYEITGDTERLRAVFLPLVKHYEWYMLYQRRPNGLYWTDTFQEADDSPRNPLAHDVVSTTSIQAMNADILADMAIIVGRKDMASWFSDDAKILRKMINDNFWDDKYKLYNDLGVDGKPITEMASFPLHQSGFTSSTQPSPITATVKDGLCKHAHMFWPLMTGAATPERAKFMAAHLADPKEFNRPSGIASLSSDSAGFNKETGFYWRGAVWPPTEYMALKGLERCGDEKLAAELAEKYVNACLIAYKAKGDITEFMRPDKPIAEGVESFVGWGGLGPIAILFEDIMGITVDAPANRVTWDIRRTERHGIENLKFGGKTVSMICATRKTKQDKCIITVDSDGSFNLTIHTPTKTLEKTIKKGHTKLEVGG